MHESDESLRFFFFFFFLIKQRDKIDFNNYSRKLTLIHSHGIFFSLKKKNFVSSVPTESLPQHCFFFAFVAFTDKNISHSFIHNLCCSKFSKVIQKKRVFLAFDFLCVLCSRSLKLFMISFVEIYAKLKNIFASQQFFFVCSFRRYVVDVFFFSGPDGGFLMWRQM